MDPGFLGRRAGVKGRAFAAEVDPRTKPGAPDDPVDSAEDSLVVADVADAVAGKIRGSFPGLISGRRRF